MNSIDCRINVHEGGGSWIGLQAVIGDHDLALFKSPAGISLTLPAHKCTVEEVSKKIAVVDGLHRLKKRLLRTVYEIDKLIEETQ